jgi:ABC-type nitrate/sulfonate/bicarbonate transport system permease component
LPPSTIARLLIWRLLSEPTDHAWQNNSGSQWRLIVSYFVSIGCGIGVGLLPEISWLYPEQFQRKTDRLTEKLE